MDDSDDTSKPRSKSFETRAYGLLRNAEICAILVLVLIVWTFAIGVAVWIVLSPIQRLGLVLETINKNWKACLLLLVPIFYRTIIAVLERMKKFPFGMEAQEPEDEQKAKTPVRQATPTDEEQG
jgi:hypothetical protein